MIEFFLRRSVLANLITLLVCVLGGWHFLTARREAFPDVKFDIVLVQTSYPGASPEEVENLVTRKIEEQVRAVSGVDRAESFSLENLSLVILRLDEDLAEREKDKAVGDLYQAVQRVEDLPELADKPVVRELTADRPLITVSVAGGGDDDRDRGAEELKDLLEDLDGVSRVDFRGDREREILVEADRAALERDRLTIGELAAAIKGRNVDRSAGATWSGPLENWVRVRGAVFTAREIEDVVVRSNEARGVVRVKDVARVREGFAEGALRARAGGKPAIELRVSKHKSADILRLAEAVKRLVAEQRPRFAEKGLSLELSNDVSFWVKRRLKVMTGNLLQGGALILAALFLFLDWRLAVVAALGVPISLGAALLVAVPLGFTFNLMSLLAFIIVLGMLDDDSVVVAENIYRHLEAGRPPFRAAADGTREVLWPVLGSVLVSACAFLPFAFMSGIMGKFLFMIPVVVVMCFLASLFEAFFILPGHVLELLPLGRPVGESGGGRWYHAAQAGYRRAIGWVIRHRGKFALLLLGFLLLTAAVAKRRLKFVLFPEGLIEQFYIQVEMPPGTNLEATEKAVAHVEKIVAALPPGELDVQTAVVGLKGQEDMERLGTHWGQARVYLTENAAKRRPTKEIIADLRAKVGLPPGAERVTFHEFVPGPPVGEAVLVRVRGRDPEVNRRIAAEVREYLGTIPGVSDVRDSLENGKRQWRIVPDPREAAFAALDAASIARDVFYAVDGLQVSKIQRPDEEVEIRLRLKPEQRDDAKDLLAIDVLNSQGRPVRLSRVASVEERRGPPFLPRYNYKPAVAVSADVDEAVITSKEANALVMRKFEDVPRRYPGCELVFGGEQEETAKSLRSLFLAFGAALLLDFAILAVLFGSYVLPLLILLTVPIGLLGVVYALLVHGLPASFMAMLGVVAMTGVVVNNAIVLVAFINAKREQGLPIEQAAAEAGADRLRPIWASSITTLLGLFPTAYGFGGYEPFVAPMALALAWGLTFAMPMTLFLIPAAYVTLDGWNAAVKARVARLFARGSQRP
ncbi:MAG: efflux RND transporter permease subunit [Elusimicrobia bacterium]|nr:efflux RND transporter permease subunit [Elusimicrobiota bacterium]